MSILQIGLKAPSFSGLDDANNHFHLDDYINKKNIILYFYPKDDTLECTSQAKDFRDKINVFEEMNSIVIGVSRDSVMSHAKFRKKYHLPFSLIADETGEICIKYGTWSISKKFIERSSFLIDKTGHIRSIWRNISSCGHVNDIISSLHSLEE